MSTVRVCVGHRNQVIKHSVGSTPRPRLKNSAWMRKKINLFLHSSFLAYFLIKTENISTFSTIGLHFTRGRTSQAEFIKYRRPILSCLWDMKL